MAPQEGIAEVDETDQLSKEEAVIGNVASFFFPHNKQKIREELHTTNSHLSDVCVCVCSGFVKG